MRVVIILLLLLATTYSYSQNAPPGFQGHRFHIGVEYDMNLGVRSSSMSRLDDFMDDPGLQNNQTIFEKLDEVKGSLTIPVEFVLSRRGSLLFEYSRGEAWYVMNYVPYEGQSLEEASGIKPSQWLDYTVTESTFGSTPTERFAHLVNYNVFALGYRKVWGIAPIGKYIDMSIAHARFSSDSNLSIRHDLPFTFLRLGAGITNVLMGRITYSAGLRWGIQFPLYSVGTPIFSYETNSSNFDLSVSQRTTGAVRAKNSLDFKIGLGYIL